MSSHSPIFLLDPETTSSSGTSHILSSIDSISSLASSISSTLGPFGRDKLILTSKDFTVSNDGAFILSSLKLKSPIAELVRQISLSQDNMAGDGTTSVCLFTSFLLSKLKKLVSSNMKIRDIENSLIEIEKASLQFIRDEEQKMGSIKGLSVPNEKILSEIDEIVQGITKVTDEIKISKVSELEKNKETENSNSNPALQNNSPSSSITDSSNEKNLRRKNGRLVADLRKVLFLGFECARTSLCSKILHKDSSFFSILILKSLLKSTTITPNNSNNSKSVSIKRLDRIDYILEPGASSTDSFLFPGLVFKKPFSYAGFERSPKSFKNFPVVLLNMELELTSDKEGMELRPNKLEEYSLVSKAEDQLFRDKLESILYLLQNNKNKSDEKMEGGVVLGSMPIGDFATQYFSERGVYAVGRVDMKDIKKVSEMCGSNVISSLRGVNDENSKNKEKSENSKVGSFDNSKNKDDEKNENLKVGTLESFEERRIGNNRYILLSSHSQNSSNENKNKNSSPSTLVLRGGSLKYLEESKRALHDAAKTASTVLLSSGRVLIGAGAFELSLSSHLSSIFSFTTSSSDNTTNKKKRVREEVVVAFREALEGLIEQLANNAGYDGLEVVSNMKNKRNENKNEFFGINLENGKGHESVKAVEPVESKINMIKNSVEASCMVMRISEEVRDRASQKVEKLG